MNMLLPNLACFLPPSRVPIMARITAISSELLTLKPVGILAEYVADMDKKVAELKAKAQFLCYNKTHNIKDETT